MIGAIVAAAGYGSIREWRGRPVPKVLECVAGVPLLVHTLRAAEKAGIYHLLVVVNPRDADAIRTVVESSVQRGQLRRAPRYVVQERTNGSGDAVLCSIPCAKKIGFTHAVVMYGDMPLWSSSTVRALIDESQAQHVVSMVTVDRRTHDGLNRYGRVIRDKDGAISQVVEVSDPSITDSMKAEIHVNPSLWIWDIDWLEAHIPRVVPFKRPDGHGEERYMPPLVKMAYDEMHRVGEVVLPISRSHEALGVNTREEMEEVVQHFARSVYA